MASSDPLVPSPTSHGKPTRSLMRWVVTGYPFYAVSAELFLFGLRLSFDPSAGGVDACVLSDGLPATHACSRQRPRGMTLSATDLCAPRSVTSLVRESGAQL